MTSLLTGAAPGLTSAQLASVLSDPSCPRMVFQPIVDTQRGVVAGYEALARFDAEPFLPPDAWFAAAARYNCAAQLEARAVVAALDARPGLPGNCFLTINLSPHLLATPEIRRVLRDRDLRGVVVELTEHVPYGSDPSMLSSIAELRAAGALIALDDAGSGYSGLQQLLAIRPEIIKVDRALVAGADRDEAKLALIRMLGEFAGHLDAWLLAEGVETEGELAAFRRLGVPLAQGWLLGRPGPAFPGIAEAGELAMLQAAARGAEPDELRALLEDAPVVELPERVGPESRSDTGVETGATYLSRAQLPEDMPRRASELVVVVDEWRRPRGLLVALPAASSGPSSRPGGPAFRLVRSVLRVAPDASVAETALRAMTRPATARFEPLVCIDDEGRLLGVVRVERLVTALAGAR